MILGLLFLGAALAGGTVAGIGGGLAALRVGSGDHELGPAVGLHCRTGLGGVWYLEGEAVTSWRAYRGDLAVFRQGWLRGALAVGAAGGSQPLKVAASAGPVVTARRSVVVAEETWRAGAVEPGARVRLGLQAAVGEMGQLDVMAGVSSRGRSWDHDLLMQLGRRW